MKTLTLSLKRKWFDMIKAGIKKEEYREIKPHYIRQFIKFEPLKNDLIIDYNFHRGFDEGEINGIESELLNLKYDVLYFSLAYPSRAEKDKWLTFKNPRIRIGTGKPEWGAEPEKKLLRDYVGGMMERIRTEVPWTLGDLRTDSRQDKQVFQERASYSRSVI